MTAQAEALLREALALPDEDRADVAAELLASLDAPAADDPETLQTLWNQEFERRARRALSGDAPDEDWSSVRQRLADELAG
ncbi:MAG: addiction module protein [Acidimicrobiales bacterium]